MQFTHILFKSYLLISFFWFCCLSQTNSDLVKGVLLGALIARQKSGEQKIIVIPVSGDKGPGDEELEVEDDMTTTEATTTTASPPMSNIKLKNTEIMQSMRQMAEMIQQILGQKTPQQSQSTTPRPRQNWKNGQQKKTQSTSSGKHVMMMMPVVSMKNMDPMETQNIAMMGSDKIEHFEPMDDYEDEDEDDSSPEESRNERRWVEKQD